MSTDWLTPAWLQRGLDALKQTLEVNPELKRQMVEWLLEVGLWDRESLTYDAAVARFNGNLNPGKSHHFRPSEVWALMKQFRRYEFLFAMCEDLGFEPPRQKPTEERHQALLERIAAATEVCAATVSAARAELALLDSAPAIRVHPAITARIGSFSLPEPEPPGRSGF